MKIFLREIKKRYPSFQIIDFYEDIFFENINHDSRVVLSNYLFVPIIGENFDGHDFISDAFENGCVVTLMSKDHYDNQHYKGPIILVDDIMQGLSDILKIVREKIPVPIIAITGSTGKTTTREMLSTILSSKGKVLKSDRNFNTLWGNAQILCQYNNEDFVVLEFGMDRKGEIKEQCDAMTPDAGILLNVGHAHAMQLGGIENVYLAEKESADYLISNRKPTFINIDDERLRRIQNEGEVKTYGFSKEAEIWASDIKVSENGTFFNVHFEREVIEGSIGVLGKGYVYNALAVLAISMYLGIKLIDSVNALKQYSGFKGRFEILKKSERLVLINDAYNANPTSMDMSLKTFNEIWGSSNQYKKILVLGDMKELGEVTERMHMELGKIVSKMNVEKIYYVGDYFDFFSQGEHFNSLEDLYLRLQDDIKRSKTVILFKASNSVGLQSVIERF